MLSFKENGLCDEKMERVSELLDELVLDSLLRLLQCIWDTNTALEDAAYQSKKPDDISF